MPRVAVIGDVGGQLGALRAELIRLGADPVTGALPVDLIVVQVGDLVHRGPDSDEVVALVDGYLARQPGRWLQLVGNHEAQYLGEPAFEWPQRLGDRARNTVRRWWAGGLMRAAVALRTGDGEDFLVTHAGLTAEFWRATLHVPVSADVAAARINALIGTREPALFRAGQLLGRGWRAGGVGPLWASAATELLPGWLDTTLPFSQLHGHDCLYDRQRHRFRPSGDDRLPGLTAVDHDAGHETTTLRGGRIVGVDPGHGEAPRTPWRAWECRVAQAPGFGGSGIE